MVRTSLARSSCGLLLVPGSGAGDLDQDVQREVPNFACAILKQMDVQRAVANFACDRSLLLHDVRELRGRVLECDPHH